MGLLIGIGLVGFAASRWRAFRFTGWCFDYWVRRGRRTDFNDSHRLQPAHPEFDDSDYPALYLCRIHHC